MANGEEGITPMMEKLRETPEMLEIEEDIEIAVPNSLGIQEGQLDIEILAEEDGGVTVDFDPQADVSIDEGDFYRNLAEEIDDGVLGAISNDLQAQYEANKETRQDWADTYSKGLELLGFKYEERTQPFRGATGVTHPLLASYCACRSLEMAPKTPSSISSARLR